MNELVFYENPNFSVELLILYLNDLAKLDKKQAFKEIFESNFKQVMDYYTKSTNKRLLNLIKQIINYSQSEQELKGVR